MSDMRDRSDRVIPVVDYEAKPQLTPSGAQLRAQEEARQVAEDDLRRLLDIGGENDKGSGYQC